MQSKWNKNTERENNTHNNTNIATILRAVVVKFPHFKSRKACAEHFIPNWREDFWAKLHFFWWIFRASNNVLHAAPVKFPCFKSRKDLAEHFMPGWPKGFLSNAALHFDGHGFFLTLFCMLCLSNFHVSNPEKIAQHISYQVGRKVFEQSCTFVWWFWRVLFEAIFCTLCLSNFPSSNPEKIAQNISYQVGRKVFEQSCTFVWWFWRILFEL